MKVAIDTHRVAKPDLTIRIDLTHNEASGLLSGIVAGAKGTHFWTNQYELFIQLVRSQLEGHTPSLQ
jgi:hypothetical protein